MPATMSIHGPAATSRLRTTDAETIMTNAAKPRKVQATRAMMISAEVSTVGLVGMNGDMMEAKNSTALGLARLVMSPSR